MKPLLRDYRFWLALAALAHIGSYLIAGPKGLQGMALGLGGTGLVIFGTGGVIWLMTKGAKDQKPPIWGVLLLVVVFLAMLPAYVLAVVAVHKIGGMGPSCFLAGMALVYCALIGWAQSAR